LGHERLSHQAHSGRGSPPRFWRRLRSQAFTLTTWVNECNRDLSPTDDIPLSVSPNPPTIIRALVESGRTIESQIRSTSRP
jgi:hypothetical protein